jgi:hypothetical protein
MRQQDTVSVVALPTVRLRRATLSVYSIDLPVRATRSAGHGILPAVRLDGSRGRVWGEDGGGFR